MLLQLEDRPVNPVVGAQRGGEHQAGEEGRTPAALELLGQDVGRVRPEVRAEVVGDIGLGELVHVALELPFRRAPGEVGVGLGESQLGQLLHHPGSSEGLGQEDDLGVLRLDEANQPFPEREGFGVRVIHPEHPHPLDDPEAHDLEKLGPQRLPLRRLEVERVDVLVALGRVLGIADRPVGKMPEPLRVLGDPRMVGRGLEGQIDGHFDAPGRRRGHQVPELLQGAQLGVDRGVPALEAADGPRTAGVALGGLRGPVAALASRPPDGVDGREVQDVEPHVGHVGQLRPDVGERPVAQWVRRGRAREHLVPRAEAGLLPIDRHREDLRHRRPVGVFALPHEVRQLIGEDELAQGGGARPRGDLLGDFTGQALGDRPEIRGDEGEHAAIRRLGPVRPGVDQFGSDVQFDRDVLTRLGPGPEIAAPGHERVHPGFDEKPVLTHRPHVEPGAPAIVDEGLHGHRGPHEVVVVAVPEVAGEHVVPIGDHIRLHGHRVPDRRLGRAPPAVHQRTDRLDHGPHLQRGGQRRAHGLQACRHTSDTTSLVRVLPDRHRSQTGATGGRPPECGRTAGMRRERSASRGASRASHPW